MSTRCQIGIYQHENDHVKNGDAFLYRHSDGYPENVLPDILPFLEKFAKHRGLPDAPYALARLTQYLCNAYDDAMR